MTASFRPFFWDSNHHHGLIDSEERWQQAVADVAKARGVPPADAEQAMLDAKARPMREPEHSMAEPVDLDDLEPGVSRGSAQSSTTPAVAIGVDAPVPPPELPGFGFRREHRESLTLRQFLASVVYSRHVIYEFECAGETWLVSDAGPEYLYVQEARQEDTHRAVEFHFRDGDWVADSNDCSPEKGTGRSWWGSDAEAQLLAFVKKHGSPASVQWPWSAVAGAIRSGA